jgi:drug/metabolite transporter (DMT)-like permease
VIGTLFFTMALASVGYIPFSVAILIQKLQPIFAIGLAMIIGHERIPKISYAFIALALVAGYFVTFPSGVAHGTDGDRQILAALYALGAAAAWGMSTNFSKYLLKNHHPEVITMVRFALTAAIIALGLLVIPDWRSGFRTPTGDEWLYLLLIASSTGLLAMYIYYRGLKTTPVHVSAILELTWPIIAVIVDYFVYDTIFSISQYIAMAILIGSMYMVTHLGKERRVEVVH